MKDKKTVDVIIPAYNEEENIEDTILGISSIEWVDNIIVVDDCSSDRTVDIVKSIEGVELVKLKKNGGKGKAIREGLKKSDGDIIALIDGDLGESSSETRKLLEPVITGDVDMTIGKFGRAKKKGGFGFVKRLAKRGVYFYTKRSIDTTLSGQRVYTKKIIDSINYIPDRFGIEVAMTVEALRQGVSFKEVPVEMTHAETGRDISGFKHRIGQFLDILKTLIIIPFKR